MNWGLMIKTKPGELLFIVADDANVILEVISIKSKETPKYVIENSNKRMKEYNAKFHT